MSLIKLAIEGGIIFIFKNQYRLSFNSTQRTFRESERIINLIRTRIIRALINFIPIKCQLRSSSLSYCIPNPKERLLVKMYKYLTLNKQ